jgi:acetyl-CoA acyltransferase 1
MIAAKQNMGIDPSMVGDICVGTVTTPNGPNTARVAALTAGFPNTVPVQVINRFCSSGLMACQAISNQIRNGEIEIGLAVGYDNLTFAGGKQFDFSPEVLKNPESKDCLQPMGWTAENVAGDFNISRAAMDAWAAKSHQAAANADATGIFKGEIAPVTVPQKQADGSKKMVVVDRDDGIRQGTTVESLSKVRPAFPQWAPGQTTGGNASQITDGGAFVLMMTRRKANELGLPILAKHIATVVGGLEPRIMGIGPTVAIPLLYKRTGLTKDDIDMFEINEAFSSMMVYCVEKLGLDKDKVNVNGGAIALGHPFGCTGARQVATGLNAMRQTKGKTLITS